MQIYVTVKIKNIHHITQHSNKSIKNLKLIVVIIWHLQEQKQNQTENKTGENIIVYPRTPIGR
jgi:hypothetical protein